MALAQPEGSSPAIAVDRLATLFDWEPHPVLDPISKRTAALDFGFLNREGLDILTANPAQIGTRSPPPPALHLLPDSFDWLDAAGRQRIPVPLCEFLAYKASLAYERPEIIKHNVENCCQGIEHFQFFDTHGLTKGEVDTQGFGFVYEDKASIILRGSASDTDWRGNLNDTLTDIQGFSQAMLSLTGSRLKDKSTPGCHLGFATGWCAVASQVEDWIASLPSGDRHAFIFSGHSLGGALACLGAFNFANMPKPRTVAAVVTFGAPRVGNAAFAKLYNDALCDQTVRVESTDDSVPDIMGRWYYPVAFAARQIVKQRTWRTILPNYTPVGLTWEFPEAPAINRAAFLSAIENAEEAIQKAEADRLKQARENAKPREVSSEIGRRPDGPAKAGTPTGPGNVSGAWVIWVFGGVVILVTALCLWLFVRHKIASHGAAQRYAGYLSTLSYRRIRTLSGRDLNAANEHLLSYLKFIRGTTGVDAKLLDQLDIPNSPPTTFYAVIDALPVRLTPEDKVEVFMKQRSNIC